MKLLSIPPPAQILAASAFEFPTPSPQLNKTAEVTGFPSLHSTLGMLSSIGFLTSYPSAFIS